MTITTMWVAVVAAVLLATAPSGGGVPARAGSDPARTGGQPAAGCTGPPGAAARCWPVAGPGPRGRPLVLRTFYPPATPWGAGHRGVDIRAGPGTAVRAAAPGKVAFSGQVGGTAVVVVQLAGDLRTTYEPVRGSLPVGAAVTAGTRLGTLSGALPHCPTGCLHWGLLAGDVYLDPLSLLPRPLLRSAPSRLLPLGTPIGNGAGYDSRADSGHTSELGPGSGSGSGPRSGYALGYGSGSGIGLGPGPELG